MGFFDELKKLTRPYDDDDDDFFGSASDDQPAGEPEEQPRSARRSSFFSDPEEAAPESVGIPAAPPRAKPAFRIPKRELRRQADAADAAEDSARVNRAAPANAKPQMFMATPTRFEDGAKLADSLLAGRTVLLNLENAGKVDARRLLDFMSGAAYALQGYVKRVSGSIYLVVPNGEEVTEADAMNQVENSGVYF